MSILGDWDSTSLRIDTLDVKKAIFIPSTDIIMNLIYSQDK